MKGWHKAGLIGGVYGIVLAITILTFFTIESSISLTLFGGIAVLLLFFATGVWAVSWTIPLPSVRQSVGLGALASLISSLIVSIFTVLLNMRYGYYSEISGGEFVYTVFVLFLKTAVTWAFLSAIGAFVYVARHQDKRNV
jgi:hypothetical protein